MHKTLLTGVATALFATAMSGTAVAAYGPSTPCTVENNGEIQTVDSWNPTRGSYSRIFECEFDTWQLIGFCDNRGCIYY